MFPTKQQWKRWSLPAKLTAVGAYVGIVGLILTIASFFVADSAQPTDDLESARVLQIQEELLKALDSLPKSPLLDQPDELLANYDAALRRDPHRAATRILRAQYLHVRTTTNGGPGLRTALSDYDAAASADPKSADPHFGKGTVLLWLAVFDVVIRGRFEIREKGSLAIDPSTGLLRMTSPDLYMNFDDRPKSLLRAALEEFQLGQTLEQSYQRAPQMVVLFSPRDIEQRIRTTRVLLGYEPQLSSDHWLGRIFTEAYSRINPRAFSEIFEAPK
jgi:hypothetical protein